MHIKTARLIYFSPTGNTKKILHAVLKGIKELDILTANYVNLTDARVRQNCGFTMEEDLAIIAVPVYGGQIPYLLPGSLAQINGNGKPAILLCVYGNIDKGVALNQLQTICIQNGFLVIAGAEFIGEHSFCNEELQVAAGRPDSKDKSIAVQFGQRIRAKITKAARPNDLAINIPENKLSLIPRIVPLNGERLVTKQPRKDSESCIKCGICVERCPMDAIEPESGAITEELCTRCFACVKNCPTASRKITFTKKMLIKTYLNKNGKERKEPVTYL